MVTMRHGIEPKTNYLFTSYTGCSIIKIENEICQNQFCVIQVLIFDSVIFILKSQDFSFFILRWIIQNETPCIFYKILAFSISGKTLTGDYQIFLSSCPITGSINSFLKPQSASLKNLHQMGQHCVFLIGLLRCARFSLQISYNFWGTQKFVE